MNWQILFDGDAERIEINLTAALDDTRLGLEVTSPSNPLLLTTDEARAIAKGLLDAAVYADECRIATKESA